MKIRNLKIIAKQVVINLMKLGSTRWLIILFITSSAFALLSGYQEMNTQQELAIHYSQQIRERWEANPDKHPHRMAHYGYVAFRQKYPLSFFDFGMDSYVGKSVFLEAHKQNTINFSEAGQSSGLLRFGQISAVLWLQLLLPLLLFFWGYDLIAKEREEGTLKLLLIQSASWQELILGKTLGLFSMSLIIVIPILLFGFILTVINEVSADSLIRYSLLSFSYISYFFVISLIAIFVSAQSKTAKASLIKLIGCWLLFTLVMPRISQVVGQNIYPAPSKVAFDAAIEAELVKHGDSHNPNDPYYAALKDSLLKAYQVDSTHKLPFNYSGVVMKEGEKLSAEIYEQHQAKLVDIYMKQQNIIKLASFFNPYLAIKNLSMALSGTDYASFNDFQSQVEVYRYNLAQTMNELQIKYISNRAKNSADKNAKLERKYWAEFPDFTYQFLGVKDVLKAEQTSILAMLSWLIALYSLIYFSNKWFKAI
jgi:ABC-2 type transport system permease protein